MVLCRVWFRQPTFCSTGWMVRSAQSMGTRGDSQCKGRHISPFLHLAAAF